MENGVTSYIDESYYLKGVYLIYLNKIHDSSQDNMQIWYLRILHCVKKGMEQT